MEHTISIIEASKMLGCTPNQVRYWKDRGVLKTLGDTHAASILRSSVEALLDEMKRVDVKSIENAVKERRRELEEELRSLEHQIMDIDDMKKKPVLERKIKDAAMTFFTLLCREMWIGSNTKDIIEQILDGRTLTEVGNDYGVSRERVRQIFMKGLSCVEQRAEKYHQLVARNKRLEEKNAALVREIEILKGVVEERKYDEDLASDADEEKLGLLATTVDELPVSIRAKNCLIAANLHSVMEIVSLKKEHLLNVRNFGKKSLSDIFEFLDSKGLKMGMTKEEIYEYSHKKEEQI